MRLGILGLGNMGSCIFKGALSFVETGGYDKVSEKRRRIKKGKVFETAAELASWCDALLLAVKPQDFEEAFSPISKEMKGKLLISIMAGIPIKKLKELHTGPVARVMPNTPLQVKAGVSAVCFSPDVSDEQKNFVKALFSRFGIVEEVPEKLMDVVTALSGSGPAFVFVVINSLAEGAVKMGMPKQQALRFAAQTVFGAASLALKKGLHPEILKDQVASPAGTTVEGLLVLERAAVRAAFIEAVVKAAQRSQELSK